MLHGVPTHFRFNLNEGIQEAKDAAKQNKEELDKMLEEEREDRGNQSIDLLDKIDKEKRDRVKSIADVQHKFEDDNEHLCNKLHERIGESIKSEEKSRGVEISKINQDIDDLHSSMVAKLKASNDEVDEKIMLQEKKDNEKFLKFSKQVDDNTQSLKKFLEDERDTLKSVIDEETRQRADEIDKINETVAKYSQGNVAIADQIKDLNSEFSSEKQKLEALEANFDTKLEDGARILNENLSSMEGAFRADIEKEKDLVRECKTQLDNVQKSSSEAQNGLLEKINQERIDRNEENSKLSALINAESEQGKKVMTQLTDFNSALDKGKEDIAKLDIDLTKKLSDNISGVEDKLLSVTSGLKDDILKESNLRSKDKEDFQNGLNQVTSSIKDSFDNEIKGVKVLLEKEKEQRMVGNNILRDKLDDQNSSLKDLINQESVKFNEGLDCIKSDLKSADSSKNEEIEALTTRLNDEIQTRAEENELMNGTFSTKFDDLKRQACSLEDIVDSENAVRKQEALDLKERMEREKQQLQEYIDKDNAALKDKLDKENQMIKDKIMKENEERKRENEELQNKLQHENKQIKDRIEGESKLLKDQLDQEKRNRHQQLEVENNAREELKKQLEQDKQSLADKIERENQQMRDKIKSETEGLATKLEGETSILKENIAKEKLDAKKEQERLEEEMNKGKMSLAERLRAENAELQERMKREQDERSKKEELLKEEMKKSREGNKNEILELFERMRKDLEGQKLNAENLAKHVKDENDKRIQDSKRIQKSRMNDKIRLQDYIEKSITHSKNLGECDNSLMNGAHQSEERHDDKYSTSALPLAESGDELDISLSTGILKVVKCQVIVIFYNNIT